MNQQIIRIDGLKKVYNKVNALDDVSLTMNKGKIYGFIGKNGAGKTTLLRILTGLSKQTEGEISLFGETSVKGIEKGRKRIGCMIEHAALYPNLTAHQNLEFFRKLKNIEDKKIIDQLISTVGLEDAGNKKFKNFSMGMKQRLGIATALMGNPELLIFDEPINGLDPLGIIEVRELLKKLNKELGITILISSHLLSELYMLATDFIIIDKGRIISKLTTKELGDKCQKIIIKVDDVKEAEVLLNSSNIDQYHLIDNNSISITDTSVTLDYIARVFFEKRIILTELSIKTNSLEDFFMELLEGERFV